MATLIKNKPHLIACKTIFEERLFGAMFAGIGMLGAFGGSYALLRGPSDREGALFLVLYTLGMMAAVWAGAIPLGLLKVEWLILDLHRGTYRGRRGLPFWTESLRGPLDDFDHIRLVEAPPDPREGCPGWVLEFAWRDDLHRPFRVSHWRRPRSFHLEHCWGELESASLLDALKMMAHHTGLPLAIPKKYLDGLCLFESEIGLKLLTLRLIPPRSPDQTAAAE